MTRLAPGDAKHDDASPQGVNDMSRSIGWNMLLVAVAALLNQGCISAPPRLDAVPPSLTAKAEVPGMPGIRYVAGGDMSGFFRVAIESLDREKAYLKSQGYTGPTPPANFLAISGGGDNGAYAAGLLNGWTASGTRPEFKLVTGISTGALIAPFGGSRS